MLIRPWSFVPSIAFNVQLCFLSETQTWNTLSCKCHPYLSLQYNDFQFPQSNTNLRLLANQMRVRMSFVTNGPSHQFLPKEILATSFGSKLCKRMGSTGEPGILTFKKMALLGVWQLVRAETSSPPNIGPKKKKEREIFKRGVRKDWYLGRKMEWEKDKLRWTPPFP